MVKPIQRVGELSSRQRLYGKRCKGTTFFDMAKYSVQNQTDTPRIFRPVPLKPSPPQRPKSHLYAFMLKKRGTGLDFQNSCTNFATV